MSVVSLINFLMCWETSMKILLRAVCFLLRCCKMLAFIIHWRIITYLCYNWVKVVHYPGIPTSMSYQVKTWILALIQNFMHKFQILSQNWNILIRFHGNKRTMGWKCSCLVHANFFHYAVFFTFLLIYLSH